LVESVTPDAALGKIPSAGLFFVADMGGHDMDFDSIGKPATAAPRRPL